MKILIIGGGVSGLFAALKLAEKVPPETEIIINEAEPRLGGRVFTLRNPSWNHVPVEMGAQWIHGKKSNPIWEFAQRHNIPLAKSANRDGEGVFVRNDGEIIPSKIFKDTFTFLNQVHRKCTKFYRKNRSDVPPSVGHFFRQEFDRWMENNVDFDDEQRKWCQQLYWWYLKWERCDTACESMDDQSAVQWGEFVEFCDNASFKNGYDSLIHKLCHLLKGRVTINTSCLVTHVDWGANDVVVVKCQDGSLYSVDHVIVTVSLGVLKRYYLNMFTPTLPEKKTRAICSLNYGTINRIHLDFERPFWNADNPGYMILWNKEMEITAANIATEWIREVYGFDGGINDHPNMLMAWISGPTAHYMESLSDEVIGNACLNLLRRVTRYQTLPKLRNIAVTRWSNNKNFFGSYSSRNSKCDEQGINAETLADPILNSTGKPIICFGGEATSLHHYSTVHGAMKSGQREAKRILAWNYLRSK